MNSIELAKFESHLLEFEKAWRGTKPPDIKSYCAVDAEESSLPFLVELVKIDLEHRLRKGIYAAAETYIEAFPTLRDETVRWDLVTYEFQLRAKFGCLLSEFEFDSRFKNESKKDREKLAEVNSVSFGEYSEFFSALSPDNISLSPGAIVNQYTIMRPIGSGSFAVVFEAKDARLGRRVALKFLRPYPTNRTADRQRTLREAHAIASLNHENIVPVFETGNFQQHDYIATQYVDGPSLDLLMNQQSLDIRQSVEIVKQLAEALSHSHANGVVHRDIKPSNVVMQNGKPMLIDFGLARLDDASLQLTAAGDVLGTPAFMPPEQADGRAWQADPRSDVYSLGVLLYQLISGQLPFQGTIAEVVQKVIHQTPVSPRRHNKKVYRDLETITLTCLEKDPIDRYQTAEALSGDLENFLTGNPIKARPSGIAKNLLKWAKRKPALAAMILTLVIALAFLIGIGSQLMEVSRQRDQANAARKKANQAELKMREMLANEAAGAGRLSMQRGRLHDAIAHFDQSIEMGFTDAADLKLRKIESLVATRQLARAREELVALEENHADISTGASRLGEIYLWQAELALDEIGNFGDAIDLFEKARTLPLPDSAKHYVDAMLATNSLESLKHFRSVLASDPFHHRARRMLITMLLSLARFEEAYSETTTAMELFPEDFDFVLFRALLLAVQGKIQDCKNEIASTGLSDSESTSWVEFCQTVDQVANHLVIHEGSSGYNKITINRIVRKFEERYLPLLIDRGWHFPPKITPKISQLFGRILLVHSSEIDRVEEAEELVTLLKELVEVHPEGSLFSLYGERLVTLHNLQGQAEGGIDDLEPKILQDSLEAFERSIREPVFVKSVRKTSWNGIMGSSLSLARVYKINEEQNISRFIFATQQIELQEAELSVTSVRAIVISLIESEAFDEAVPWCDYWIELAGENNFDAVWHRLMVDRWRLRWYDVLQRCNAAIERFPDVNVLRALQGKARVELRKAIDSEAKSD